MRKLNSLCGIYCITVGISVMDTAEAGIGGTSGHTSQPAELVRERICKNRDSTNLGWKQMLPFFATCKMRMT